MTEQGGSSTTKRVAVDEVAIAHSGDKGDISNVAVIPLRYDDYPLLVEQLTAERVKRHYGDLVKGSVERYELPGIRCLNFVLNEGLGGGVSRSLRLDKHGMSMSSLVLAMEVEVPQSFTPASVDEHGRVSDVPASMA